MSIWKRNLYICWIGSFFTAAGMNLVLPFMPLYVELLGEHDDVEFWSALAFSVTFLTSAIFSPIWGRLADKYGRKPMLIRASLGMAVIMTLIGFVQDVQQLVLLRLCMGAVSGFIPASIILVASQTPDKQGGKALGILSTGGVAGTLIGPLLGGLLGDLIGLRHVFWITGGLLFLTFLITLLVKENFKPAVKPSTGKAAGGVKDKTALKLILSVFVTTFILQAALMSIQPFLTLYVKELSDTAQFLALMAGGVTAVSGFSNIIAAPLLGKLSDRIGPQRVLIGSLLFVAIIFALHTLVSDVKQLIFIRFLLGFGLGGLLPAINTYLKIITPGAYTGKAFGYNQTAHNLGSVAGPLVGSQIASGFGIPYVFWLSCGLLLCNALWVSLSRKRIGVEQKKHNAA
ncbi:MAG: MFS transporter [Bacillus sp. (in: firmicutes)]